MTEAEASQEGGAPRGLAALADSARLRKHVLERLGSAAYEQVTIRLRVGGSVAAVEHGRDECASGWLQTGCLTKIFTAALIGGACRAGELALDDGVARVLGTGSCEPMLAGVTMRQLLEHTHGLDGSLLGRVPVRPNGFIDRARLGAAIACAPRLCRPGRLYSYGDLGAWLAAAVLERITGERYAELLAERLLAPLGVPMRCRPGASSLPSRLCPAAGGPLAVPASGMLDLAANIVLERDLACFESAVRSPAGMTRMPGWSLLERGILLGWKHYGGGWFGHHSTWPGAEALVRVHTRRRVVLVLASSEPPAVVAAAKLFGASLPELGRLRVPSPITSDDRARFERARYCGVYRTMAETVRITASRAGELALHARLRARTGSRTVTARLVPAREGLLLTVPTVPDLAFVQRVESREEGAVYLWNGRRLWRGEPGGLTAAYA